MLAASKYFLRISILARTQIKIFFAISNFPFLFRMFG